MRTTLYILLPFLLIGCLGTKKTTERSNVTRQTEKSEMLRDSSRTKSINRAIDNEYMIPLKSTDSLVNELVREAFSNFSAGARSGSNSTRIVFDEDALAFKIASIVGETSDIETTTTTETKMERSFEQILIENTKKVIRMIPMWVWVALLLWFAPQIMSRIRLLVNPLIGILKKSNKR
ncbi:hypothetical protein ACFQ1M_09735 [Sungkyunkwania multivorans]|uniref:Lipoprotein n=1 Tax=Sungkyunkwania multivorans TaxID=1173618 RepID=A0ABW3D033_9FLAO